MSPQARICMQSLPRGLPFLLTTTLVSEAPLTAPLCLQGHIQDPSPFLLICQDPWLLEVFPGPPKLLLAHPSPALIGCPRVKELEPCPELPQLCQPCWWEGHTSPKACLESSGSPGYSPVSCGLGLARAPSEGRQTQTLTVLLPPLPRVPFCSHTRSSIEPFL